MRPELIGPKLNFVELWVMYCLKKGEELERRAKALGMSDDALADMARDGVETIDFNLNLLEQEQNARA